MYIRISQRALKILTLPGLTPRESHSSGLEPWLKMELGRFCSSGTKCLETFWFSQLGRGVLLVMLLNNTQHSSPTNNYPGKNGGMAKVEKPCSRVWPGDSSVQLRLQITVLESPRKEWYGGWGTCSSLCDLGRASCVILYTFSPAKLKLVLYLQTPSYVQWMWRLNR